MAASAIIHYFLPKTPDGSTTFKNNLTKLNCGKSAPFRSAQIIFRQNLKTNSARLESIAGQYGTLVNEDKGRTTTATASSSRSKV
jgi:hypothetical protein